MKNTTTARGTKYAALKPVTTLLALPREETTQRPDPDPSDVAYVDVEDPTVAESELFRPRLRLIPE